MPYSCRDFWWSLYHLRLCVWRRRASFRGLVHRLRVKGSFSACFSDGNWGCFRIIEGFLLVSLYHYVSDGSIQSKWEGFTSRTSAIYSMHFPKWESRPEGLKVLNPEIFIPPILPQKATWIQKMDLVLWFWKNSCSISLNHPSHQSVWALKQPWWLLVSPILGHSQSYNYKISLENFGHVPIIILTIPSSRTPVRGT